MMQVLIRQGKAVVEHIPAPQVEQRTLLVAVDHSCISAGTEIHGLKNSGTPLWKRALHQPENVKKVLQSIAHVGMTRTRSMIAGKLAAGNTTGYSASGRVIAVGSLIDDVKIGDRVACAGAQCAFHAEIINVPRNLAVILPEKINFPEASTVTLGAIALQGIRRANPHLGETFVVIGLGILGQLTAQMLRINGCRVIGIDPDSTRVDLAKNLGLEFGFIVESDEIDAVYRLTDGRGADGVIITAATASNTVISTAFKLCRKKGRVVLVGDVGLSLKRSEFYQKELDFYISCSYGPGRYDPNYEEKGIDYPFSYVRWTENRNMSAYLEMLADKKIQMTPLISDIYDIKNASNAYERLNQGADGHKPLIVLLKYPAQTYDEIQRTIKNSLSTPLHKKSIGIAVVGAGGFAKAMHLPNLMKLKNAHLQAVMSRSGSNAKATASQFGANYATTDYEELIKDPAIHALIITTRHNTHADLALRALDAGKHVLVEKPLALTAQDLEKIIQFYKNRKDAPIVLTGFNRRFSKIMTEIKQNITMRTNPMMINYRMNAGYIPLDHWVHGEEGGGRNLGEACHIYDLFTFLTDSRVKDIVVRCIIPRTRYYLMSDNFTVTLIFEDGTVANLMYTALGDKRYPKELMEIFYEGKVIFMNDYKSFRIVGKSSLFGNKTSDKGQFEELSAFVKVIENGGDWPIPLWQQIQATHISLEVDRQLRNS